MQPAGEQRRTTILIVDAHPAQLQALETTLAPLGQQVVGATSGEQALELLGRGAQAFACLLLEAHLPGLDGWETATRIKALEHTRHLPILFVTSSAREEAHVLQGYASGAVDYIITPYAPEILRAKVKVFVDLHLAAQAQVRRQLGNDITERNRAADTAAFLAQASATLSSSLDYTATLAAAARLAVPTLCDWCMVDLEEPDGTFRRVAVAYEDPALAELAERARQFPPTRDPAIGNPPTVVALRGKSVLVEHVTESWLQAAAMNERHLRQLKALGFHSVISVPLVARGNSLGVLTFLDIAPGRHFTQAELTIAEELARRAALAVDNARLYTEAQQAVRLRDEFLSVASHELKTPLTPLSLRLQTLEREARAQKDSPFGQRVLTHLEVGRRQVKKLTELIDDLLDVARISAERLRLELEPVDLSSLVREVSSRFEPEAGRAQCTLELQSDGSILGTWDRLRLEQVVTNLLSNAIKYGAGKPIHIQVEAVGERARLTVRDEGIGIEPQEQARIFEKFERAVSERNYGGLGLGLFITRQIVNALSGRIQVTSTPGHGAAFTVELPLTPSRVG